MKIDYLSTLPKQVPAGRVLVHNQVRPRRTIGASGSRVWLSDPDPKTLEVCDCGWAPELGKHYRVVFERLPPLQKKKKGRQRSKA